MTEWTTGAAILEASGAAPGSPVEIAWAETCAEAVNAGVDARLDGAIYDTLPPLPPELARAATRAGVLAYKTREASLGGPTPPVLGEDYLEPIEPILERYVTTGIA